MAGSRITNPVRQSELFRFVNIRNPEPAPKIRTQTGGLHYTPIGIPYKPIFGGTVITGFTTLSNDKHSTLADYQEIVDNYIGSDSYYFSSVNIIENLIPGSFLSDMAAMTFEDRAAALTAFNDYIGNNYAPDQPAYTALYPQIWNNYVVQMFAARPDMGIVSGTTNLLKSLTYIDAVFNMDHSGEVPQALAENAINSYVIMPPTVLPSGSLIDPPAPGPDPDTKEWDNYDARVALNNDIDKLRQAKVMLSDWATDKMQVLVGALPTDIPPNLSLEPMPDPPPAWGEPGPNEVTINQSISHANDRSNDTHNPYTKGILVTVDDLTDIATFADNGTELTPLIEKYIRGGHTYRLSYLLDRLSAEIQNKADQITQTMVSPFTTVAVVGKSLFEKQTPDYTTERPTQRIPPQVNCKSIL